MARRFGQRWYLALPIATRLWLKVYPRGDCWEYRGSRSTEGYGSFAVMKQGVLAHRMAFELAKGTIPAGYHIDHLCNHPWCVKPSHLVAATVRANVLRGQSAAAHNARKIKCDYGHPLTGDNVYSPPGQPTWRQCRACIARLRRGRTRPRDYTAEGRRKQRARGQVDDLVRRGKIVKPRHCERCGTQTKLQAHHTDYNRPLDVQWLCQGCHSWTHRAANAGASVIAESAR